MKIGDLVRCGQHKGIIIREGMEEFKGRGPVWFHILWFDGQDGWKHKMLLEKVDESTGDLVRRRNNVGSCYWAYLCEYIKDIEGQCAHNARTHKMLLEKVDESR